MSEITNIKFSSQSIERLVLAFLLKNKSYFIKLAGYLTTSSSNKKSYFIDAKLQWILNVSWNHFQKYNTIPTSNLLESYAEKQFSTNIENINLYKKTVSEIFGKELGTDLQFYVDEALTFIRTMKAFEATKLNQLDIMNGKFDALADRLREATNIRLDEDMGANLENVEETLSLIQQVKTSDIIPATKGIQSIIGSPAGGELLVYAGVPGIGKTVWLGQTAVTNTLKGKKGAFASMEVSTPRLATRLYANIFNLKQEEIYGLTVERAKQLWSMISGGLRVKQFPTHITCANDLLNWINNLKTIYGYQPDYLCVDYILIMSPNDRRLSTLDMYSKAKIVAEELRNLSFELDIPVFTAVQINRNGMGDQGGTKGLVTSKDISESRGVLDTADYCLIINQTSQEKKVGEKDGIANQRLYIDKNRNGKSGSILDFQIDYNKMTITDGKKELFK